MDCAMQVLAQILATLTALLVGRDKHFMVGLTIQLVEAGHVVTKVFKVCRLINDTPSTATLVSKGLNPSHRGASTTNIFNSVADGLTFAVPWRLTSRNS